MTKMTKVLYEEKLKEIKKKFKVPISKIKEAAKAFEEEEKGITPDAPEDDIRQRVVRDLIIKYKSNLFNEGKEFNNAVFLAVSQPFNFHANKIREIKKLYKNDPYKASTEGIGTVIMNETGKVVYKKRPDQEYEPEGYVTNFLVYFEKEDKVISLTSFGEMARPENASKVEILVKQYTIFADIEGDSPTIYSAGDYEETTKEKRIEVYEKLDSVKLDEVETYFNHVTKRGKVRHDIAQACLIEGGVMQVFSDSKFFIDDIDNLDSEPVVAFVNSAQSVELYKGASVKLIATMSKSKQDKIQLQCFGIYVVPIEEGGYRKPEVKEQTSVVVEEDADDNEAVEDVKDEILTSLLQEDSAKLTEKKLSEKITANDDVIQLALAQLIEEGAIQRKAKSIILVED